MMKTFLQFINEDVQNVSDVKDNVKIDNKVDNKVDKKVDNKLVMNNEFITMLKSKILIDNNISKDLLNNVRTKNKMNFINCGEDENVISYLSIDKIKDVYKNLIIPEVDDVVVLTRKDQGKKLPEHAYNYLLSQKNFKIKNVKRNDKGSFIIDIGYISSATGEEYYFLYSRFTIINKKKTVITDEEINSIPPEEYEKLWDNNLRQVINVGRFIKELFKDKYTDLEYETFTKLYINQYNNLFENLQLVEGENIKKYYNNSNYSETKNYYDSNLHGSCMGGASGTYFNIYASNPDKIKLLILKDNKNPKLIMGRALVWFLDEPENSVFLDTVYSSEQKHFEIYKKYAEKMGWIYKSRQAYADDSHIHNGEQKHVEMMVKLNPVKHVKYPFVDTMCYYNSNTGVISNNRKYNPNMKLRSQNGYYDEI
jgi:hypothetical protein